MVWWWVGRDRAAATPFRPEPPIPVPTPEPRSEAARGEAAWAHLPAVQRALAEPLALVVPPAAFRAALTTSYDPSFLAPLDHLVDPSAGGVIDGLAHPAPGSGPVRDPGLEPAEPAPSPAVVGPGSAARSAAPGVPVQRSAVATPASVSSALASASAIEVPVRTRSLPAVPVSPPPSPVWPQLGLSDLPVEDRPGVEGLSGGPSAQREAAAGRPGGGGPAEAGGSAPDDAAVERPAADKVVDGVARSSPLPSEPSTPLDSPPPSDWSSPVVTAQRAPTFAPGPAPGRTLSLPQLTVISRRAADAAAVPEWPATRPTGAEAMAEPGPSDAQPARVGLLSTESPRVIPLPVRSVHRPEPVQRLTWEPASEAGPIEARSGARSPAGSYAPDDTTADQGEHQRAVAPAGWPPEPRRPLAVDPPGGDSAPPGPASGGGVTSASTRSTVAPRNLAALEVARTDLDPTVVPGPGPISSGAVHLDPAPLGPALLGAPALDPMPLDPTALDPTPSAPVDFRHPAGTSRTPVVPGANSTTVQRATEWLGHPVAPADPAGWSRADWSRPAPSVRLPAVPVRPADAVESDQPAPSPTWAARPGLPIAPTPGSLAVGPPVVLRQPAPDPLRGSMAPPIPSASGVSFARMFAATPSDAPGLQRDVADTPAPPEPEPEPEPAATPVASPAPGTGSGASPAASTAPSAAQLEEMARQLYDPLAARLRAELWLDRERSGSLL